MSNLRIEGLDNKALEVLATLRFHGEMIVGKERVWYIKRMNLALAKPKQNFRIVGLSLEEDTVLSIRLRQLGFVEGVSCECVTVAPFVKSPFLILIRGMRVALTREEAASVRVQEVDA